MHFIAYNSSSQCQSPPTVLKIGTALTLTMALDTKFKSHNSSICLYPRNLAVVWEAGCEDQTRETMFHRDIQTPRRELKIQRAAEYF